MRGVVEPQRADQGRVNSPASTLPASSMIPKARCWTTQRVRDVGHCARYPHVYVTPQVGPGTIDHTETWDTYPHVYMSHRK